MAPDTIAGLLAAGTAQLAAGAAWVREDAASEAEYLLAAALGFTRTQLRLRMEAVVPADVAARFAGQIARRASGEPVAYIHGEREFWSLPLQVGPGVLVPRPDTECLVEVALRFLRRQSQGHGQEHGREQERTPRPRVLDLGTGSGAIALALATELPDAQVVAVEMSATALRVAADNMARLAPGRVELLAGHWYEPLQTQSGTGRFTCIVSNPPYLAADDPHLPSLAAEPREALVSGPDGLECYREIVAGAPAHLEAGGLLAVEHGHTQGAAVRALFAAAGFTGINTHRDLARLERVTSGVHAAT